MNYKGKLYGKVAGKYIQLESTTEDVVVIGDPASPQQMADMLNAYVAMDADGYWWWHMLEPKPDGPFWVAESGWDEYESCGLIVPDLIDWEGDWKNSLHKPNRRGA
jgi:hypothetical protein